MSESVSSYNFSFVFEQSWMIQVFNKTQREKFRWAIDMGTEDFVF